MKKIKMLNLFLTAVLFCLISIRFHESTRVILLKAGLLVFLLYMKKILSLSDTKVLAQEENSSQAK